jgi:alkylated DNA repair dioxygenase AlkB
MSNAICGYRQPAYRHRARIRATRWLIGLRLLRSSFAFTVAPYIETDPKTCEAIDLSEQLAFLSEPSGAPQGLRYATEFISPSTEQDLIARIAGLPLQPFQFGQYEGKRRVASFGFNYDYTLRRLQDAEPMPEWLGPIVEQVEAFGGPSTKVRQVLCTEYDTGVGIGWHRDKPHFDRVFGLSWALPANFASAAASQKSGNGLHSMPGHGRST